MQKFVFSSQVNLLGDKAGMLPYIKVLIKLVPWLLDPCYFLLHQPGTSVNPIFHMTTQQQNLQLHILFRNYRTKCPNSGIAVTLPPLFPCFSMILHPSTKHWASAINNCIDSCFLLAVGIVMVYLTFYLTCVCISYTKIDSFSKPCVESAAPPQAQKYSQATCEGYL